MSRVGEKIKNARLDSKMTQKQLAKKLGVAESFVNDVEMGKRIINESLITRISKILDKNINDISMSIDEEALNEETVKPKAPIYTADSLSNKKGKPKEEVQDIWNEAFGDVLKNIPIFNYDMSKVVDNKKLPVISNKIEGHPQDKVFFLQIENDDMAGFRMRKGDLALCHFISDMEANTICLIEVEGRKIIRKVKRLDNNKALLLNHNVDLDTETVLIKNVKFIARLDKLEILL
ncbi:S24 family peptidase [Clostridium algidicarnis]|uniref:S24 family peptidase n=1 Tax=Clostridium algidicarnis TaxID=37659 RepID=UPI000495F81B|nr:S24 family peptidase [Clostridium algidicarnis]